MSMTVFPEFFAYKKGGTDKWYAVVELPGLQAGLSGYGPCTPTHPGTWTRVRQAYAREKQAEKQRQGYTAISYADLPRPALASLLSRISGLTGGNPEIAQNGTITIHGIGPGAPRTRTVRPRRRADSHIIWI